MVPLYGLPLEGKVCNDLKVLSGAGLLYFRENVHSIDAGEEYESPAKILLDGLGADEQLAGYGRHRTTFKRGGYALLQEELELDFGRLWKRNLGTSVSYHDNVGRER